MKPGGHPRRTTAAVGVVLALLLAVGGWAATWGGGHRVRAPDPAPVLPPPSPAAPTSRTVAPPTPQRGRAYPVRVVGALRDRSVIVPGRGNADLRYARARGNGTRVHLVCTGCDGDTWLVEQPRGAPVGGGPLADPSSTTGALDTVSPGTTTDLLVKAPAGSDWAVTLTPFDAVPRHETTFDGLDDDVVAVHARGDLQVRCPGPLLARALARPPGAREYAVVGVQQQERPGTYALPGSSRTARLVVVVRCTGRWTLTLP